MNAEDPLRVGIVCDLLEERWPSMDLVADALMRCLPDVHTPRIEPVRIRPAMPRWPAALARMSRLRVAVNANRYLDRHRRYPRWLRRHHGDCDAYHIVDHTYAHLVHELPASRTVVTCHDVDAFRALFDPVGEPRSRAFRRMAQRVLEGLRRAAIVACDSVATRDALTSHGLRSTRLEVIPLGVDPAFTPAPTVHAADGPALLLHVGSTIPRKRIDLLLQIFTRLRAIEPGVRLVRVGGPFTPEQRRMAATLGVLDAVDVMPTLERGELVALYRRSALVLMPSDAEGFGLPVVESMACGTPVVASDLPVLREVGGESAAYARRGDMEHWVEAVASLLAERRADPARWAARRAAGLTQAARFRWDRYAQRMAELYAEVAHG
ncbi:MAG: glycosyltransferase family 4 protein [Gemmatimonadota bacterium]|nr:glycosyltransferase family 4 protein [Gemmatimonadota bacterium]